MLCVWHLNIHANEDIVTYNILRGAKLFDIVFVFYLFLDLYDACSHIQLLVVLFFDFLEYIMLLHCS